ncbi:MAG: UDP-glucose 4-epimerase GalE, partial [Hyphomicrobiales bacterium]|nr:UDP-glucose 4-epimerase GalE [Hyphomicrobiales bacterium]
MPILVTGGAGYIGSHMVLELLDAGEKVVVLDDLSTGFASVLPEDATFIRGDVGDRALVLRLIAEHAVNAIAHFAAKVVVPESVADPLAYYHANAMKSRNLVEAAIRGGVRHVIFSSTAAVYGNPRSNPVGEDEPLDPLSPYGRSKLMTEWMLEDAGRAHGLRSISLRYFNVAGADPQGRAGQSTRRATHLIKAAAQVALGERPYLEVFGTDYPTKDGS